MRRTAATFLLAVLALVTQLAACSPAAERGHRFTVRGQVTQLPSPQDPGALYLQHEAIDGWVDRNGQVVGMDPMNMPFPLGDGVPLEGIAAGDVVEATVRVDWEAEARQVEIVELRELPAGTKLELRAADPGRAGTSH
ncbi:MAG TPA: copper-binding protein [Thermoanaerobaculia bacterium]|nr:copper-binding protein [Thermoanaerobaculia bacterium]